MRLTSFIAAAASLACVSATPFEHHAVHEKRTSIPHGWSRRHDLHSTAVLPMRIGLTQRNLDTAYERLMDVSHPGSAAYGQHWSAKQVVDHFAPSQETVDNVMEWLKSSGIATKRIRKTSNKSWLEFNATTSEVESLLKTKYSIYDHESGHMAIACTEYSLPSHLKQHVDIVTPTLHFDTKLVKREDKVKKSKRSWNGNVKAIGQPGTVAGAGSIPKLGETMGRSHLIKNLTQCASQITPDCLRALYQFPANKHANPKNSYGIVEYTPQAYLPSDLDLFFANFSPPLVGSRPIFDSIDGGILQTKVESFNYNGESDLDLEYAMTLVYPQNVTLYQVGDITGLESFNNFLDGIDASYCSYEGGDDPLQDATYPDGVYNGTQDCGKYKPTNVISTSYGYNEGDLTPFYEHRQCNEYMKLGLMGTSVVYSSGDYGVAGNGGQCIVGEFANNTAYYNNGTTGRFNPAFPSVCPYVTSIGATQVKNGTNILYDIARGIEPEMACEEVIYSGGGFSRNFDIPAYQSEAVLSWFANYPPPYGADRFNNSQKARGFPDISANGANYVIGIDGNFSLVYGTSASAPVVGSILTLINQARLDAGKSTIGFINPVAYANPQAFNDITMGGNQGCGTAGFSAAPGWDPVTGLGTPSYPKLLKVFLDLP